MAQVLSEDAIFTIQRNSKYLGKPAYYWNILGNRTQFVNTTSLHDVCEFLTSSAGQQSFIPVQSTDILEIVSSSAADSAGGTGTSKVKVVYLNASGTLTESPDITLTGTTPVAANFSASGILWMEATDGGSSEVSAGNIVLRRQTVGTIFEQITAGGNKSLSSRIRVPAGFTGHVINWNSSAVNQNFDARLRSNVTSLGRTINNRLLFQDRNYLAEGDSREKGLDLLKFPELTRIKISVIPANVLTARVDTSFSIVMISN